MNEIWKPIKGYEGFYEVSNLGRVRSLDRTEHIRNKAGRITARQRKGKVLKPCLDSGGHYLHVMLRGKPTNVHRIVAKTFIDNPNDYPEANHIDEDKTNNCVMNLEWCDHKYNNNYGSKIGSTRGTKNPSSKLTEKDIIEIRRRRSNGETLGEISKGFGISESHVCNIARGGRWGWLS